MRRNLETLSDNKAQVSFPHWNCLAYLRFRCLHRLFYVSIDSNKCCWRVRLTFLKSKKVKPLRGHYEIIFYGLRDNSFGFFGISFDVKWFLVSRWGVGGEGGLEKSSGNRREREGKYDCQWMIVIHWIFDCLHVLNVDSYGHHREP